MIRAKNLEYFSKSNQFQHNNPKASCPFNYSHINNIGVNYSNGDILAFVTMILGSNGEWLGEMVSRDKARNWVWVQTLP